MRAKTVSIASTAQKKAGNAASANKESVMRGSKKMALLKLFLRVASFFFL
jgi:hypothetical protein